MILVRAQITDLAEQADRYMGGGEGMDGPYASPPNPFMTGPAGQDAGNPSPWGG